jgi:tetratricopeptide (TPR) repeat protein
MAQEKEHLQKFRPDFANFVELGFIAIKQCDEQSAIRLLGAAYMLQPDHPAPHLGLGYLYLNMEQLDRAIVCLEESLKRDPNLSLAKALLGGALILSKKQEPRANKLLDEAAAGADDPDAKKMAELWMGIRDKLAEKAGQKAAPARK